MAFQRDSGSGGKRGGQRFDGPRKSFGGGGKSFGGGFGGGFGDKPMYSATCAECGSKCQVPFKPNGSKPVYCSNCFKKDDGYSPRSSGDRFERSSRDSFGEREMFRAECDSCGDECEVPFRPSGDKPVFCKTCFGKNGSKGSGDAAGMQQLQEQVRALHVKLDTLLSLIKPTSSPEAETAKKVEAPKAEVKAEAVAEEAPKKEKKKAATKKKKETV